MAITLLCLWPISESWLSSLCDTRTPSTQPGSLVVKDWLHIWLSFFPTTCIHPWIVSSKVLSRWD